MTQAGSASQETAQNAKVGIEVDLQVRRGSFTLTAQFQAPGRGVTAVYGPSGSGKTSLLRALAGLERSSGRLALGTDVLQNHEWALRPDQRLFGYVFQEPSLFPHLNVQGNLEFGFNRAPHKGLSVAEVVHLLGLGSLQNRPIEALSGGEQQRVAIGRAILANPRMLLMDEPISSLDDGARVEVMTAIERVVERLDIPTVYVSHQIEEIARLADYLIVLRDGCLQAGGPLATILTRPDLPLCQSHRALAVLMATVTAYDAAFDLSTLEWAGGMIQVPGQPAAIGQSARAIIPARDVSLSTRRHDDSSVLNMIAATVTDVIEASPAQWIVRMETGGQYLLARISRQSAERLGVKAKMRLFAQVKAAAL